MTEKFDAEKYIADLKKKYQGPHGWGWNLGRAIGIMLAVAFLTALVTGTGWMVISFVRFLNG